MNISISVVALAAMVIAGCDYQPPRNREPSVVAGVTPVASPAPPVWYSANSELTRCFESRGPATRLDQLNPADRATTRDFKDYYGRLYKVEVIVEIGFGKQMVNTYYRDMAICEQEQIDQYKILADQYR